jgi:hypothetical protein
MTGVGHDDGRRLGDRIASVPSHAMRTDGGGHARACRTTPERIAFGAYLERAGVPEDVGDGGREVLRGHSPAVTHPVAQHECVVPALVDLHRVGESFVDRTHVGEPAAGSDHCEGCAWPAAEKEQSCLPSRRLQLLLGLGVDVEKDLAPRTCIVDEAVQPFHYIRWLDVLVIRKQRADRAQLRIAVDLQVGSRQQQRGESGERGMGHQVAQAIVHGKMGVQRSLLGRLIRSNGRWRWTFQFATSGRRRHREKQ